MGSLQFTVLVPTLPCRLGGPHRFTAGGRIKSGPQVGKVAT